MPGGKCWATPRKWPYIVFPIGQLFCALVQRGELTLLQTTLYPLWSETKDVMLRAVDMHLSPAREELEQEKNQVHCACQQSTECGMCSELCQVEWKQP